MQENASGNILFCTIMVFIKSKGKMEEPAELFHYQVHFQSLGKIKKCISEG